MVLGKRHSLLLAVGLLALTAGCKQQASGGDQKQASATPAKLGIRPYGDETVKPDMAKIKNPDLNKVFKYIDDHIDDHVVNLQKWIQQPSISNTGEGIQESAEMVKGFFDQLGCQKTQVFDPGKNRWGSQSNPVVYAKCDEGAKKTLVVYWQGDTMPVTQPDLWKAPPFEGRLVEQAPFKKVLIGRGAINSKGPEMTFLNAIMSIKAVTGKLPVNLIFVVEHDEERMDVGLNAFMQQHADLLKGADGRMGRRRLGRLRVRRADHQRRQMGARAGLFGHSRLQQAVGGLTRLAPHPDAVEAGVARRQQGADPGLFYDNIVLPTRRRRSDAAQDGGEI